MKPAELSVLGLALLMAGCQSSMSRETEGLVPCEEPRPEVCTRDYRPVCAEGADGTSRTYANGCDACVDTTVRAYRPGACE
jgi:hypothetical protein